VDPHCHFDTCFWYPNKNVAFLEYLKQVIFNVTRFEEGGGGVLGVSQTKTFCYNRRVHSRWLFPQPMNHNTGRIYHGGFQQRMVPTTGMFTTDTFIKKMELFYNGYVRHGWWFDNG
jgi:hypothetical protein